MLGINALNKLIDALRGENGCPWDKKQTPRSMSVYLVEEMYELLEAIESGNTDDIREELGDVLFHILFIAKLFQERGSFNIEDAASATKEKMIRRHPHVFGNSKVSRSDELRKQWHCIKMNEKTRSVTNSIFDSVPSALPALRRAYRISERAARVGFDWDNISDVMQKVEEEWSELKTELNKSSEDQASLALEFGDVIFTLVNVARFARIHPENALTDSIKKFENRFKYMEKVILKSNRKIESVSQGEKNELWEEAKKLF
ncbi:MAG: nucleoside triphosphate pyrophosphohydrolase [Proteobacteria bacterium]|nr:nucleoside triphosphate pyrophosphohydrolase [Desulfobacteraceae bacterium]MBU2521958.1 nucleoside triphosphate pyrophosphohydrolase [Pseudomonadota bacterium]MBU3979750.1 nucleoside triphosphate pyrophosphohydrolase [Pseudomonadota bacterium]MBU4013176.1 nucleoside triphosphate pyrophosphohydrolase [Pseudomonadota bacterium]MBU4067987.1 nucleoside triphosphate pyrophosphohydrolase [Pseudomonadota bacterium]